MSAAEVASAHVSGCFSANARTAAIWSSARLHGFGTSRAKQLRLDPDREKLRVQTGLRADRVEMAVVKLLFADRSARPGACAVSAHVDGDARWWIEIGSLLVVSVDEEL